MLLFCRGSTQPPIHGGRDVGNSQVRPFPTRNACRALALNTALTVTMPGLQPLPRHDRLWTVEIRGWCMDYHRLIPDEKLVIVTRWAKTSPTCPCLPPLPPPHSGSVIGCLPTPAPLLCPRFYAHRLAFTRPPPPQLPPPPTPPLPHPPRGPPVEQPPALLPRTPPDLCSLLPPTLHIPTALPVPAVNLGCSANWLWFHFTTIVILSGIDTF